MREAKTVDWDLSSSHTMEDVGWPEDRLASRQIAVEPIESLNVTFPGGLSYQGADDVKRVWLVREGNIVYLVQIDFEPQTLDDAYERAKQLSAEWDLDTDELTHWDDREAASPDDEPLEESGVAEGKKISSANAHPYVEISYSFDDERPALVSLAMVWRIRD